MKRNLSSVFEFILDDLFVYGIFNITEPVFYTFYNIYYVVYLFIFFYNKTKSSRFVFKTASKF